MGNDINSDKSVSTHLCVLWGFCRCNFLTVLTSYSSLSGTGAWSMSSKTDSHVYRTPTQRDCRSSIAADTASWRWNTALGLVVIALLSHQRKYYGLGLLITERIALPISLEMTVRTAHLHNQGVSAASCQSWKYEFMVRNNRWDTLWNISSLTDVCLGYFRESDTPYLAHMWGYD